MHVTGFYNSIKMKEKEGEMMIVDVLGTPYTIVHSNKVDDMCLENMDGYCDTSVKRIVIGTFKDFPGAKQDLNEYEKEVIRHELVHAFLFESGLDGSSWAKDEEVVDWIALQFPKLLKAFEISKCI